MLYLWSKQILNRRVVDNIVLVHDCRRVACPDLVCHPACQRTVTREEDQIRVSSMKVGIGSITSVRWAGCCCLCRRQHDRSPTPSVTTLGGRARAAESQLVSATDDAGERLNACPPVVGVCHLATSPAIGARHVVSPANGVDGNIATPVPLGKRVADAVTHRLVVHHVEGIAPN